MKRHGNLFNKITSIENIELAYQNAKRGKTWQNQVKVVEKDKDNKLKQIQDMLINGTFTTSPYRVKTIYEPKQRDIFILPFFPDRIIQHAIMNVISPIWDKMFIHDSYACRKKKGQHKGSIRCMQFAKRNEYAYQFDISKFYPSINHTILLNIIKRKIKDKKCLSLLENIIRSVGNNKNVPIGNYTSQWFGNLYLNELDYYVKHTLHIRDYIRYCDDFIIFGNNKNQLKVLGDKIEEFITNKLMLKLSKKSLFHTYQGVDFLGYRHFNNGKILIRKSTVKRIRKRLKLLPYKLIQNKITKEQALGSIASANGWIKHAKAHHLRIKINLNQLQEKVKSL